MGTANCITTAAGDRITPPKAKVPMPAKPSPASSLTRLLADVIGDRWTHGADFMQIADAVLDKVAHHIRSSSIAALHPSLADAIEDNMHVDPLEGDADQTAECSIEDIEAQNARRYARESIASASTDRRSYTQAGAAALVGAMLRRPSETERYEVLRDSGYSPAAAVAIILHERRVGRVPPVDGACQCCRKIPDAQVLRYSNGRIVDGVRFYKLCLSCASKGGVA